MVIGGMRIRGMGQRGKDSGAESEIRNARGIVVSRFSIHTSWTPDGGVRAQLELRFEDKPSAFFPTETGLGSQGYAHRRSWVVVEMEPREGVASPMRFSVNIPGETGAPSHGVRPSKAAVAAVLRSRDAIQAVRGGCGHTDGCDYPVCDLATVRRGWELANDGCIAKLVSLET